MAERTYMTAKKKRDAAKASKVGAAEAEKKKLVASQEAEAKKAAEAGPFMSKEEAEAAGIAANTAKVKNEKALKEADNKIAAAGKSSDFDKGRDRAIEVLGEEGLGRLGEDKEVQDTMAETKAFQKKQEEVTGLAKGQLERQRGLTSRYEKMADEGISSEAQEAQRTQMAQLMNKQAQMAGLRMGGAMGGAKGAGAMAQQRSLTQQSMMGRAGIERDIFLASEQAKERGLAGMAGALQAEQGAIAGIGAGVAGERAALGDYRQALGQVKTFDIGQAAAEKELIGSMGMQYEQLAQADRAAKMAADAQIAAGKAQCFLPGTLILMEDGSMKKVEEIQPGDHVAKGGYVHAVGRSRESIFYKWGHVVLGRGHAVKEKYGWVDIDYADESVKLEGSEFKVVHNFVSENHCAVVAGQNPITVGDYYSASDKSMWSKLVFVPYKKLKRGVSEVISSIFKSNVNEECNG